MLREVSDLQESDEDIWGCAEVSFTIETNAEEDGELVRRRYTFSRAPEWDKWMFTEFEEKRSPDVPPSKRRWRRSRKLMWHEREAPTVDVPPEVTNKLEELLDLDEMTIQEP